MKLSKLILLTVILITAHVSSACSMYKVTEDGKTIVGNNEDWISPNSKFWFDPGSDEAYGIMYMGLLNNFPQGGINEAGLVFDGFANPHLDITNTADKLLIPIHMAVHHAMQSYDNVEDVKKYLSGINLSSLTRGQIVFVDIKGKYLIVEGDELIIGDESEKIFSNFYYSQVSAIEDVELENVKNGITYTRSSKAEASLEYCSSVMKSLSNTESFTQYSTIYDLDKLVIRAYLYHDFTRSIEIDLKKELAKGRHEMMIADLFPKESEGGQFYSRYNSIEDPTAYIKSWVGSSQNEKELIKRGFAFNINWIGYEWLNEKNDPKAAIKIFKYATEIMPSVGNLYDSLGEAYYRNEEYDLALMSYQKAYDIDPKNTNATDMIEKIKKVKK